MKAFKNLSAVAVVLFLSSWAWAQRSFHLSNNLANNLSKKECFTGAAAVPFKYCIHTPENNKVNGEIVYLLHGRNLDENTWNDKTYYTTMIQKHWASQNATPPTVVSVSFGPVWLLTPKGNMRNSGLMDVFTKEVIAVVEGKLGQPKARLLLGESMGGINSLIVALKSGKLFKKVASLCAPVYTVSPFASEAEIQRMIERTGADPQTIAGIIQLAKAFTANENEWNEISPLSLIEKTDVKEIPELYVSCGLYDKYGNYEGAERLAERAQEKGVKLSWRPLYGGHCVVDVPSVAEFLIK